MKIIVLDASVILKWVLPIDKESDAESAIQLRQDILEKRIILKTPALWLYEVGNTLCRLIPQRSREILQSLIDFGLNEVAPTPAWLKKTQELTQKYSVTFYDAAYHALAIVEKGTFVTADTKYVNKAKESGHILTLSDLETD